MRFSSPALACSLLALAAPMMATAQEQDAPAAPAPDDDYHTSDAELVVTAPYVRSLDLFGNVGVVEGDDLAQALRPQIGETLAREPGVSATSFAPGVSRPVLRGFQGERVRVLVDGIGSIDASNTSADHAVAIDPLTAERIEILRGPASLLFGSSAIGGAVNIFDRRIPRAMPEGPAHVDALATYGSAADERSGGASIDLPLGRRVAFHVDGAYSKTNDLRIAAFQSTPTLRAAGLALAASFRANGDNDQANEVMAAAMQRGSIRNSATRSWSAGSGVSVIAEGGSLGVSISYLDSHYGLPSFPGGESGVSIGLSQWRGDFRGEVEFGSGFIDRLRVRGGFADYQHSEFEGDEVGTVFLNQGIEARAELVQAENGGWSGASGVQYAFRDFNAIGAEAFLPQNDSEQFAVFTLQEIRTGRLGIELSARYEQVSTAARSIGVARRFATLSGAVGISREFGGNNKIGVNVARTSRAPSAEELFSNGPHLATQSFEVGNVNFARESAWSVEGYLRLRDGPVNLEAALYASWFDNFIHSAETGVIADDLPVFGYVQGDARYYGGEISARANIVQVGGFTLSGDIVGDVVRARLSNGGGNIPRIPPVRVLGGLEAVSDTLTLRAEIEWSAKQNRIAAFETATDGFTLVNASAQWKPLGQRHGVTLILSGNNLFNVSVRRHASFTKDFVPLSGRDIRLTARLSF